MQVASSPERTIVVGSLWAVVIGELFLRNFRNFHDLFSRIFFEVFQIISHFRL